MDHLEDEIIHQDQDSEGVFSKVIKNIIAIGLGGFLGYWAFQGSVPAIILFVLLVGFIIYAHID